MPRRDAHCGLGKPPADGCAPAEAFGGKNGGFGRASWAVTRSTKNESVVRRVVTHIGAGM